MPRAPLHDRLYRVLLRLFPREFRGDFGQQMLDDFRDQREDAQQQGRRAARRLWRRTLIDALRRAPREHLDILRRDAGYAVRLFARRSGMTASALLTLAIGIGLNAAVFSVLHGVLLNELPLPDAERLVYLSEVGPPPGFERGRVSPANAHDWEDATQTLDGLAAISWLDATILDGAPEVVRGAAVSEAFFRILPAPVALGRLLNAADYPDHTGEAATSRPAFAPRVAVISHELWLRRFGGDPQIIGRQVRIRRLGTVEVVGVLARGFDLPLADGAECWFPDVRDTTQRRARYVMVVGRLAQERTVQDAQAEFDVIAQQLAAAYPEVNAGRGISVRSLREHVTADIREQLWLFGASAFCVLLIVCANVSNLLIAFMSGRRRELATRLALGAARGQLVRQTLTEGLVLALAGGLGACLLAWAAVPWLVRAAPDTIPRLDEIRVGPIVVFLAMAVSLIVGLVSGLAAVAAARRHGFDASLRTTNASARSQGQGFRQALIVTEIAVALVLTVCAALLVQTVRAVGALPLGFDPSNVISVGLSPDFARVQRTVGKAQYEADLVDAIRSVPGVLTAGIGSRPLGPGTAETGFARRETPSQFVRIDVGGAGPGYLEALGAQLAAGRFFSDSDRARGPAVAIVNETARRQHFPDGALGRVILVDGTPTRIVGVLEDVRMTQLEAEPRPMLFLPSAQTHVFWTNNILVRTAGDPRAALPAIRTAVQRVDPELPLTRIQTLEETLAGALAPRRFTLSLVGLFSILAVGLAVVGINGVVVEAVAQRVPEIGVRMALGATPQGILRMVLAQGGVLIGLGVVLGGAAALAMSGAMRAFVFRVPTTDPAAYLAAAVTLTLATLGACALPARRAARIDPVVALRQE
ncbi:MAG TPA: ABC transporter permease [Vicinamibacterales bacterium]